MTHQKKEDGVSPVVGVMLMLVVTIIIAAVVAAFAGGLAGTVEKTPTISFDVTMDDNGLLLSCLGADEVITYGKDFTIYINKPNDLNSFTEEGLNLTNTTVGYTSTGGIAFSPGKTIYYSYPDLTDAYKVLNATYGGYNAGSNAACWTYGGSNGKTNGLPVTVQLRSPSGQVLAQATGICTRTT